MCISYNFPSKLYFIENAVHTNALHKWSPKIIQALITLKHIQNLYMYTKHKHSILKSYSTFNLPPNSMISARLCLSIACAMSSLLHHNLNILFYFLMYPILNYRNQRISSSCLVCNVFNYSLFWNESWFIPNLPHLMYGAYVSTPLYILKYSSTYRKRKSNPNFIGVLVLIFMNVETMPPPTSHNHCYIIFLYTTFLQKWHVFSGLCEGQ